MTKTEFTAERPTWRDLYDPQVEILNLETERDELRQRVRDVQQHAEDVTHAAVAVLRAAEIRIDRLRGENKLLRDENRALRDRVGNQDIVGRAA